MLENREESIYETDSLAIAAYFDINGLKYLGCKTGVGRNGSSIVIFIFNDCKGVARDLERSYRNSNEKKYRDSLLFFRNEIFLTTRERKDEE